MTDATPAAPTKLFREEANTGSVKCLSCGGPITLHGFGATKEVTCPYCGSVLEPEDSGSLTLAQAEQRQRRASVLPLHARGKFEGKTWEIIGIAWHSCVVDGVEYPWQEFLLYNPYHGYRYLIYSMSDHHWTIGGALDGVAKSVDGVLTHRKVVWKGKGYKHFQSVYAAVTYVEGEYPWQVRKGDAVHSHEFVAPPASISVEEAAGDGAMEVNYTALEYIDGREVWKAFGMEGAPPKPNAVGSTQPNPHRAQSGAYWKSMGVLLLVWIVAAVMYSGGRADKVVYNEQNLPIEPTTAEIELGTPGKKGTIEVTFAASPLNNSWAYADVMLVSQEREEAIGFPVQADFYSGVSGGESWSEGSKRRTVSFGGVEGGKYLLQIIPQVDKGPNKPKTMALQIKSDVGLGRYILIPFLVILFFPFFNAFRGLLFEGKRWQNSDHASNS